MINAEGFLVSSREPLISMIFDRSEAEISQLSTSEKICICLSVTNLDLHCIIKDRWRCEPCQSDVLEQRLSVIALLNKSVSQIGIEVVFTESAIVRWP